MLKKDPAMPDEEITLEYLCDELWFVGSPETVAKRISDLDAKVGGFGSLLTVSYDAKDERAAWERSLQLLTSEVMPACSSGVFAGACA